MNIFITVWVGNNKTINPQRIEDGLSASVANIISQHIHICLDFVIGSEAEIKSLGAAQLGNLATFACGYGNPKERFHQVSVVLELFFPKTVPRLDLGLYSTNS